ncbi:EF-hand calcium-binding domain-containing protein 7-like isoform X2 [Ruditapes philippinarum]|uniref:EF-hand calcium-binding domain-containing protein 7-like isoform X2 n=1 Tax=Ruditapes philippinarum TaxID=129788 RepID=UPI00295BF689|nr:EF-hand calcium-binding domain-containing protein 7-like isoform X2 [Ruditapes philippinarum]
MSSSRRSSRQSDTGSEIFLECKAAFLSIYDDINDKIESKKRLNNVLQQSGRNPTKAALNKYWTKDTEELSFNDFVDICRKEPVTTADDLMKAFRKIDINGDGYISLDELYKIMNAQGESMSRDDVKKMIDEVDENKDGRLDYGEIYPSKRPVIWRDKIFYDQFTNMIMKTTEDSKKFSMKVMEKKERKKRRAEKSHNSASQLESLNTQTKSTLENEECLNPENNETKIDDNIENESNELKQVVDQSETGLKGQESESKGKSSFGSVTSLRSRKGESLTGSVSSLRSESKKNISGSQISVRTLQEETSGSKVALRSDNDLGSKVSLSSRKSNRGSQISLKQAAEGSKVSVGSVKKEVIGSKTSLMSFKEEEKTAKEREADRSKIEHDTTSLKSHDLDHDTPESPKKDSPKASPRSRSDSLPKSGVKKATPREQTMKDSGAKETPRRELSARHDKPPLPDSPKTKDSSTDKAKASKHEKLETPKTGDSARSVGEEIDFDDDFDIVSTGRPTPRIDLNATAAKSPKKESKEEAKLKDEEKPKSDDKKEKDVKESARDVKDENGLGSQASIRSGDKEISAPVPSPRKSVSRLSEDDVPRPSPRVKGSKGKSPSTKSRDKMPDPKSLQDWMHYTSKGCFFYEEEEIVSHIYSLKLTEDSSVYLSAHPIQEPACLDLPGTEPIDTALYIFDSRGKFVTCTENRDTKGTYGVKCELSVGEYQVLPYTTGCRFKPRSEALQEKMKESKLVKTKDDKVVITAAFRRALEEIFDLCDLDDNGTMSKDEFNWFNLRTSGEELGEDEWEVVEEKTALENGEITKQGFIELNEMEAEDSQGDVEDLWITLTSMGMNKALIMDEACPYRIDVYVEESGRKKPSFKVTGIESLDKREFVSEICQYIIERAEEPTKIRNMKDLYMYTDKTDLKATIVIDNKSRSNVSLQVNCSRSKNVVSNRPSLDHTVELEPQSMAIAHHLLPKNELSDWSVACTENILK